MGHLLLQSDQSSYNMKVAAIVVCCLAAAMANNYPTKAYEPRYPTHGYQRNDGYAHKNTYNTHENKYDNKHENTYNTHENTYNTHENKYDNKHENTYNKHETSYSHCDSYGYGSYMYSSCRKCA